MYSEKIGFSSYARRLKHLKSFLKYKNLFSPSSSAGADFCMKSYPVQQNCFSGSGGLMRGPDSADKRISHYWVPPSDLLGLARTSNTNLFCK